MLSQSTSSVLLRQRADLFFGIGLQVIGTMFFIRLIVVAGLRLLYPFIPQFSAGLGLTAVAFSWLIFARSMFGITGPLFGVLADRYGRRRVMAAGLLLQSIGLGGLAMSRQWWSIIPMLLLGFGTSAFLPVQLAYISDLVSYEKRGRAIATIDLSYAMTGILVLPLAGWLIDAFGWRTPFLVLSIPTLLAAVIIWFRFPTVETQSPSDLPWAAIGAMLLNPHVLGAMAVGMLLLFASSASMTIWGVWLSADFQLTASRLGLVATAISGAELVGIFVSALYIDRIGKRRGSQIGVLLTAGVFLLLPLSRSALVTAVAVLVLLGGVLEFTTISLLSLLSEQLPQARAMMFSLAGLGMTIGMGLGPPATVALWEQVGLWAVSIASAVALLLTFGLMWYFLKESPAAQAAH